MSTLRTCSGDSTQFCIEKVHFLENPQMTFFLYRFTAWYPKISKFLRSKSMMSQLSNALSNVLLRPLDQKLSHFEVQKYHCYSALLRSIVFYWEYKNTMSYKNLLFLLINKSSFGMFYKKIFSNLLSKMDSNSSYSTHILFQCEWKQRNN